jgi:3-phenylpropionate/trans-cinnamate dioxygenase ferredoxin subunit
MEHWEKVAESTAELFQEIIPVKKIAGKRICFARYNDRVYAFSDKCPHAGGRMSGGYIDVAGNIVCPLHRYKFKLAGGYNTSGEGYHLKTYEVRDEESGVWVKVP